MHIANYISAPVIRVVSGLIEDKNLRKERCLKTSHLIRKSTIKIKVGRGIATGWGLGETPFAEIVNKVKGKSPLAPL